MYVMFAFVILVFLVIMPILKLVSICYIWFVKVSTKDFDRNVAITNALAKGAHTQN